VKKLTLTKIKAKTWRLPRKQPGIPEEILDDYRAVLIGVKCLVVRQQQSFDWCSFYY